MKSGQAWSHYFQNCNTHSSLSIQQLPRHNAFSFHLHVADGIIQHAIASRSVVTHPCEAVQFLYPVHHLCKREWLFSLTSLGTRWAGSLATEQQWLTLSIIQRLTRIGWSIKAVFWHRWQLIFVECQVMSDILHLPFLPLMLHPMAPHLV